jgi:hypothetical protein
MPKQISTEGFTQLHGATNGLIPISIDIHTKQILWQDLGTYHFYEGFFDKSLDTFNLLNKTEPDTYITPVEVLSNENIVENAIYPTGFIFHAGRCRSTLLAKALGRSRKNLIISEAQPLNQVWEVFTDGTISQLEVNEPNKKLYKALILSLTRKRLFSHQYAFIKFTSFNIRFFNFIHSVFPDVPAIFITRDVNEIINSFEQKLPAWMKMKNPDQMALLTGSATSNLSIIINGFLNSANEIPPEKLNQLDYKGINPENLANLLSYFQASYEQEEMNLMKSQFLFDSKVEFNQRPFNM